MLKAGNVSGILYRAAGAVSEALSKENVLIGSKITVSLTTSDGNLLASSCWSDSTDFATVQRVSAVAASIASEYRALEKLMSDGFRSVLISTEKQVILCEPFSQMKEGGLILIVSSITTNSSSDKAACSGVLRSLSSRIKEDFFPSLSPVLENLILVTPIE